MRKKKNDKKAKQASDKAIIASVTEEMARPHIAESVRIAIDKQMNALDGKRV